MTDTRLAVFDLDDTLVDTSDVYYRARTCFLAVLAACGIDPELGLRTFEAVDTSHMEQYGFAPDRYGRSMAATYERLAAHFGVQVRKDVAARINDCGRMVIDECPKLIEGAVQLLHWASEHFELCLLTRGLPALQIKKIETTGLSGFFSDVEVVRQKDVRVILQLISDRGSTPDSTWVIGDSIKSDINPGIEAGANCILYLYAHSVYQWTQEYGAEATGPFYLARTLAQVRDVLECPSRFQQVTRIQ
jgi:putative hydrolase of the HAD superfamily